MTSQASDILSQLDGELLEISDSPVDQLPSSLSHTMSIRLRNPSGILKFGCIHL
ncbi:hypothetical protein V1515DRAFT_612113 [Lipomyces mesembrius]